MIDDLNQRMNQAAEQMARLEKLRRQAQSLEAEYRNASATAEQLRRQLAKEERDVTDLEGLSISGLFASMLGNKDERLQKERQEAVTAQLKFDEARVRQQQLAADLAEVQREIAGLQGVEAGYQSLLAEKERVMQHGSNQGASELFRLSEREQQVQWQLKELEEARKAGANAEMALQQVESSLNSAAGWGTWDMLGGGLIATAMKHSRIDDARNQVHYAQQALARFHRELKDVQAHIQLPSVQLDGFTRFADFFFDGLLMDWVVQSRINESLRSIQNARGQVGQLLHWLGSRVTESHAELQRLQAERRRYVEGYRSR